MDKNIIQTLQVLIDDLTRNPSQFKEADVVKAIIDFQKKVLLSRKTDPEIRSNLMKLTTNQIKNIIDRLNISLLFSQTNKNTLANLTTSLIQQTKKKEEFTQLMQTITIAKPKVPGKRKTKPTISAAEYENYRKKWLTTPNPDSLSSVLDKITMNELRRIVDPWSVKPAGRKKDDLVMAIIEYIKHMKRLTRLGT